jgi:glucose-1-phosphate cytidylyltransferase
LQAVILAGGLGTRLAEETETKPKPMVQIGDKPILWHIMKIYAHFGVRDFVICLGYRGYVIKEYFANYFLHTSDVTINLRENQLTVHRSESEDWKVTLIDTGVDTMIGGRIKRAIPYIEGDAFFLTYGDGVADVDINALVDFHRSHGRLATVTAAQPPGRFGALVLDGARVERFQEKPVGDEGWINAGFFVLSPRVADYIEGDQTIWEREPLDRLAKEGELMAYLHRGFWQPMDTLRDKRQLEELWHSGSAPWRLW